MIFTYEFDEVLQNTVYIKETKQKHLLKINLNAHFFK